MLCSKFSKNDEKVQNNNSKENDFNENLTFTGNKDIQKLLAEKNERYNIEYHPLGFEKKKTKKKSKGQFFSLFEIKEEQRKLYKKNNAYSKKMKIFQI